MPLSLFFFKSSLHQYRNAFAKNTKQAQISQESPLVFLALFPAEESRIRTSPVSFLPFLFFFSSLSFLPFLYFSGASGNRSITYFPRATLTIGTPGTFLSLLFKSRSFVPTR